MRFDAIIIGGGAAGLFCAIEAGKRGRKTLVIEHNAEVGRKIIISGGGRCNFTNINTTPQNFISNNPHFAKSALARYTPQDFIKLLSKHKIAFQEKKLGQLFCRESSRQIVDMLLKECRAAKVQIKTNCTVKSVKKHEYFELETTHGTFTSGSLVIACGGLSFPKVGATDFGYQIARQFGLSIIVPQPALVPLEFDNSVPSGFTKLAGVTLNAEVSSGTASFRENILFTHRGMSGPAILQISNYWDKNMPIAFDILPENDIESAIRGARHSKQLLQNFLSKFMPASFAETFCRAANKSKPLDQLNDKEIAEIAELLHDWQVKFNRTAGYDRAEVTIGGVDTKELSSQTMECKKVPGLYFIGEVVDVTGWLGGYNFQWAWASGYAAGQAL